MCNKLIFARAYIRPQILPGLNMVGFKKNGWNLARAGFRHLSLA